MKKQKKHHMPDAEASELITLWKTKQDRDAFNKVIVAHLPLASYMASRFLRSGELYDDLFQVASLSLITAIEKYEPGKGTFAGLAGQIMSRDLMDHVSLQTSVTIRTPQYRRHVVFGSEAGLPQSQEIRDDLKRAAEPSLLIDDDENFDLEDATENQEERLIVMQLYQRMMQAIEQLPSLDQEAVRFVYLQGDTMTGAAARLGISRDICRKHLHKGLERLRELLTDGE